MKGTDFQSGDKGVIVVPNDFIDNVCLPTLRWVSTTTYAQTQQVSVDASVSPAWVTSTPYAVNQLVTNGGALWKSLTAHTDAVAPVEGAIWTQVKKTLYFAAIVANTGNNPYADGVNWVEVNGSSPCPSILFCSGASGTIQAVLADGSVLPIPASAVPVGGLVLSGKLRVRRVMNTGTTATGLIAIAE